MTESADKKINSEIEGALREKRSSGRFHEMRHTE